MKPDTWGGFIFINPDLGAARLNGAHVCLGQHLAQLEMRLLFEELAKRVDSAELAGEPKCVASLMVSGLKNLPVRCKLR